MDLVWTTVLCLCLVLVALRAGYIWRDLKATKDAIGVIHIDLGAPEDEQATLYLELDTSPEELSKKRSVVCLIDPIELDAHDSQSL